MENENDKKLESIYSKRLRAGKRRTYFFDIRSTKGNDYYLTITESRKRFDDNGYERHKVFIYKEDLNKFIKALGDTIDYVKTELMPDFDFDAFSHEDGEYSENEYNNAVVPPPVVMEQKTVITPLQEQMPASTEFEIKTDEANNNTQHEEVDKW